MWELFTILTLIVAGLLFCSSIGQNGQSFSQNHLPLLPGEHRDLVPICMRDAGCGLHAGCAGAILDANDDSELSERPSIHIDY